MMSMMEFPQPATIQEAIAIQQQLQRQVRIYDDFATLLRIGAVDVSYSKKTNHAYATYAIFRLPALTLEAVYRHSAEVTFPYVPGLLSFREIPVLLPIFQRGAPLPDLLLVDGQGIAHPRFFGIAAHLGIVLNVPAIGCAKSRLVGVHKPVGVIRGSYQWLFYKHRIVGAVLRSRTKVRPLYISPGHRVSIPTAVQLVQRWISRTRLPDPIRFVDQQTRRYRQQLEA